VLRVVWLAATLFVFFDLLPNIDLTAALVAIGTAVLTAVLMALLVACLATVEAIVLAKAAVAVDFDMLLLKSFVKTKYITSNIVTIVFKKKLHGSIKRLWR